MAFRNAVFMSEQEANVAENALGIRLYPGYMTPFTHQESPFAKYPNGTPIRKSKIDHIGERHAVGSLGKVLGSISAEGVGVAYFIEWGDSPQFPSLCREERVERVNE